MIKTHLDLCNKLLNELIAQTELDLTHIKEANHKAVKDSVEHKNKLIAEFTQAKKDLDNALIKLSDGGKKNLAELLDDEDKEKLGIFKKNLQELQTKNKEYAKLVLVVKNFFDGLLNSMFHQQSGTDIAYDDKKEELEALFKMNV